MEINDFKLERYFAKHEFTAKYLMSSSDCDGFPMRYVLHNASADDLRIWNGLCLGYTESEGGEFLRNAIARYYNGFSSSNVVVASPGELNFIAMNVLLKPTDSVVVVHPCYQSLVEVVRSIGCKISYWCPNPETWEFSVDDLDKLVDDSTRLIIVNFPHNPTGAYLSPADFSRVMEIAEVRGAYVFSDEMYRGLVHGGLEHLPPACTLYNRAISLWGTSKTFGLAGVRVGWFVSADTNFLRRVVAFKDYLSICSSAPSEVIAAMALNNIDAYLQPNLAKIRRNIELFTKFVGGHDLFSSFVRPKSGSTAFVKLADRVDSSSLEFSNLLVAETGIMTVPAEMFDYKGRYLRVGFGRENFPEVLGLLDGYLSK